MSEQRWNHYNRGRGGNNRNFDSTQRPRNAVALPSISDQIRARAGASLASATVTTVERPLIEQAFISFFNATSALCRYSLATTGGNPSNEDCATLAAWQDSFGNQWIFKEWPAIAARLNSELDKTFKTYSLVKWDALTAQLTHCLNQIKELAIKDGTTQAKLMEEFKESLKNAAVRHADWGLDTTKVTLAPTWPKCIYDAVAGKQTLSKEEIAAACERSWEMNMDELTNSEDLFLRLWEFADWGLTSALRKKAEEANKQG